VEHERHTVECSTCTTTELTEEFKKAEETKFKLNVLARQYQCRRYIPSHKNILFASSPENCNCYACWDLHRKIDDLNTDLSHIHLMIRQRLVDLREQADPKASALRERMLGIYEDYPLAYQDVQSLL